MVDQITDDASSGPETPVRRKKVRPKKVTPNDSQITHDSRDEQIAALTAKLRIQDEDSRRLRDENTLLKAYIGESPASYTEGGNVRFMQWNLQDLTNGGDVQGPLWEEERLRNIVNTILFHKPDVVAIEEVKAGDGGLAAFNQIVGRLRPHGYEGDYSDAVSGGPRGERVGLIWRTTGTIGLPMNKDAVTFNLLVDVNGYGRANAEDENTVTAAATCLGLDVKKTVKACAKAFCDALPSETSKSRFDRHLVLATLQTKLGQPLHVLIGHLATKKDHGTEGNTAEVNVIKEIASRAWRAGVWLFVMADTNTDEADNRGIWDAGDARTFKFKERGCRALPSGCPTNVYPYQYRIQDEDGKTIKATPKRNDEIFIPGSWRVVSAETARMCPAALGAWAPAASNLLVDVEEGRSSQRSLGKNMNLKLTLRWSDHLAIIAEVCFIKTSVEPDFGAELNALFP